MMRIFIIQVHDPVIHLELVLFDIFVLRGLRCEVIEVFLTGPLFPLEILFFFVTIRQMGIEGIYISAVPPLIGRERSRNMPTPL